VSRRETCRFTISSLDRNRTVFDSAERIASGSPIVYD
jgi:hypothetical protein